MQWMSPTCYFFNSPCNIEGEAKNIWCRPMRSITTLLFPYIDAWREMLGHAYSCH